MLIIKPRDLVFLLVLWFIIGTCLYTGKISDLTLTRRFIEFHNSTNNAAVHGIAICDFCYKCMFIDAVIVVLSLCGYICNFWDLPLKVFLMCFIKTSINICKSIFHSSLHGRCTGRCVCVILCLVMNWHPIQGLLR